MNRVPRRSVAFAILPVLSLLTAGCQRSPPAEGSPATASPAGPVSPSQAARLDEANLDAATTRRVVEALAKAGIQVGKSKPVRASTVRARYCTFAETASSVGIAVCEYGSEAAAIAGREFSLTTYAMIKNREVIQRGSLTLTVAGSRDLKTNPEARKALEVFRGL
ncbi:MAG: hypothetical protein M3Y59_11110 [Myxococcota bacterium]|nr:hypothetical protein [Myxococcota bacterium]